MKIYNSNTFPEGLGETIHPYPDNNGYDDGYKDGYDDFEKELFGEGFVINAVYDVTLLTRNMFSKNFNYNPNYIKRVIVKGLGIIDASDKYEFPQDGKYEAWIVINGNEIKPYMFNACNGLKSIIIPEGVEKIAANAFDSSEHLESVGLPSSLTYIAQDAFSSCISLENIELPAGLTHIGMGAFRSTGIKKVIVPGGVKDIPENCFIYSSNLTSITLNEGVETIGNHAFYLGGLGRIIVTLNLPTSLKKIGECAFGDMIIENDITINPDILVQLSFFAVYFNGIVTTTAEFFSDKGYFFPYNGLEVFRNLVKVTGGTMDRNLIKRGYDSESKKIWACPPILKIGENVTIAERGFAGYYYDDDDIPVSDVTISTNAIGDFAFIDNHYIQTVTISEGVEKTGNRMFIRTKNLKHVTLPITLKTVATATFNQTNLDNIIIPKNVTAIEDIAFWGANINEIMMLPTTPPTLGEKVFESYGGSVIGGIYVPDEAVDAYKSAWSEWASLIKPMSER